MLNDDEIVTSVQEESDPVDDETGEDVDTNNESSNGPSNAEAFSALEAATECGGTNNNQSSILLNYFCSRESETLRRKNKDVQKRKISDYFPQ
ncbi:hypothetical protein TNCV_2483911 [Trichonephila clavipes]|uniref:Uncharacterized protein n=1 Tax=Trichonephila clavipes TaxID=2585209 RepID=A0A8X6VZU6_TRICX|nr:hypothetical protein TNCV_2483911 [Trichonephila clavipes]